MKICPFPSAVALGCVALFVSASAVRAQSVSVSVSPPPSRNIAVNLIMTGTAALGGDYVLIGDFNRAGQVIIPAGQSTSTITLHSLYDDDGRFNETAIANIVGGRRYRVGSPSHAQVTIENKP